MDTMMTAIEVMGQVDEERRLQLDELLPIAGPRRVRVIVLYSVEGDISEMEWLMAAANNPTFSSLKDASEDIYSLTDGVPFRDEI